MSSNQARIRQIDMVPLTLPVGRQGDKVNWTERAVRDDMRGAIAENLPPILERIGIPRAAWLQLAKHFETHFCSWIGQAEHVERVCERRGQRWARGIRACRRLFRS